VGVDPDKFIVSSLDPGDYDKYSCDLCFIGAYSRDRERYLSKVSDFNLKIFGWKGWEKSSLAKFYGGPLSLKESIRAYNCAKICINLNTVPPVNGVNLKTFEIPAAGGFQLSDFREDVNDLFVVGEEIEIFHNENELREKVVFYMKNEQLRKNIAQAGRVRVLRDHTLEKRVAAILKILEDNQKPQKVFYFGVEDLKMFAGRNDP
jgi:spore maturation protein CgeB